MSSNDNKWSIEEAPDLSGKVAIVTGANTGLGFETAKVLARKGAQVVMACRNAKKAEEAMMKIKQSLPSARLEIGIVDLGELASVRHFAERQKQKHASIHLLVNNAGLMMPPYGKTKDGFEQQWGVNYLGHFLLTALLMERLES
jgi:NAD(P)-dependent dehydrogenase (short-subunit alcohol dehydrogenase family)